MINITISLPTFPTDSGQTLSTPFPLLVLLLPPHVLEILPPPDLGAPGLLHHNACKFIVLHGPVVKLVLVTVLPLVITENKVNQNLIRTEM